MFEMKIDNSEAAKWFRRVLVAQVVFAVLGTMAGLTLGNTLPADLQEYVAQDKSAPGSAFVIFLDLLLLGILVVTIIGLWNFKSWSRKLYLTLFAVAIPTALLGGPMVMNSWEWVFWTIAKYLDACSFFMMFFVSPIKEKFQTQNKWKRNWQKKTVKDPFKTPGK